MSDIFDAFCKECCDTIRQDPGPTGRRRIAAHLQRLLSNTTFVAERLGADFPPGRHTLFDDPETGICVLGYNYAKAGGGTPHDHGASWAVYGQAKEYTDIREYDRVDGGTGAGPAEVRQKHEFRLNPGKAALFDVGVIHSIHFPAGGRVVRVTGVDLDKIPKLRFDMANKRAALWFDGPSHGNAGGYSSRESAATKA